MPRPEAAAATAAGQWGLGVDDGIARRFPTGGVLTLARVHMLDDSGGHPARMAAALRALPHSPPQPDLHPGLLDSLERIGRLAEPRLGGEAAGTTRRGTG